MLDNFVQVHKHFQRKFFTALYENSHQANADVILLSLLDIRFAPLKAENVTV